jgi:hypothetical protein
MDWRLRVGWSLRSSFMLTYTPLRAWIRGIEFSERLCYKHESQRSFRGDNEISIYISNPSSRTMCPLIMKFQHACQTQVKPYVQLPLTILEASESSDELNHGWVRGKQNTCRPRYFRPRLMRSLARRLQYPGFHYTSKTLQVPLYYCSHASSCCMSRISPSSLI